MTITSKNWRKYGKKLDLAILETGQYNAAEIHSHASW